MNLSSEIVNNLLSVNGSKSTNVTATFDINDKTFAEILAKQFQVQRAEAMNNIMNAPLGIPAGMEIQNLGEKESNLVSRVGGIDVIDKSIKFKTEPEVSDFIKKHALGMYEKYSKYSAININEFVEDAIKS